MCMHTADLVNKCMQFSLTLSGGIKWHKSGSLSRRCPQSYRLLHASHILASLSFAHLPSGIFHNRQFMARTTTSANTATDHHVADHIHAVTQGYRQQYCRSFAKENRLGKPL